MIRWEAVALFAAALVVGVLGTLHLVYTFHGRKLRPRDAALEQRMAEVSPWISRDTTMLKTWIGFNASHSMAALLFSLVYGWLAVQRGPLWLGSAYLAGVGLVFLLGLAWLGWRYWFWIPLTGILVSLACYVFALAVAWG